MTTKKVSSTQPSLLQTGDQDNRRAVIDIGSHSLLLLVATGSRSDPQILEQDYRITALGEGMSHNGIINGSAAERTLEVLVAFIHRCHALGINRPLLVATGALRNANNKEKIQSFLSLQGHFPIHILTEHQEAQLTRTGALSGLNVQDEAMTMDLGGHSTELTSPFFSASLPIGCQVASEIYLRGDPPLVDEIEVLRTAVRNIVSPIEPPEKSTDLICSGGTATTLAALDQGLHTYQASHIHGYRIPYKSLQKLVTDLVSVPLEELTNSWKLEPHRTSVLPAGAVILQELCLWHGGSDIIVSARGLTWGVWMEWNRIAKTTD